MAPQSRTVPREWAARWTRRVHDQLLLGDPSSDLLRVVEKGSGVFSGHAEKRLPTPISSVAPRYNRSCTRTRLAFAGVTVSDWSVGAAGTALWIPMSVRADLAAHVAADPAEAADLAHIRAFVAAHHQPFDRGILQGHLTASAVIVSDDGDRVLLVHHRRLDRWLQPGGHGEPGETDGGQVALREALEETGVVGLVRHPSVSGALDVDVHRIPARGDVPEHDHLDLRYLVTAPPDAKLQRCTEETQDARWFTWDELAGVPPGPCGAPDVREGAGDRRFRPRGAAILVDRETHRDGAPRPRLRGEPMKRAMLSLIVVALCAPIAADEGMWTFDSFPRAAVKQKYGVDVTDAWLASLRSRIARLENGCTGSFVSGSGLVLTNHHCAQTCLAENSSATRDLVADGFLAASAAQEVKCQSEQISVLVDSEDVTARVKSEVGAVPAAEATTAPQQGLHGARAGLRGSRRQGRRAAQVRDA